MKRLLGWFVLAVGMMGAEEPKLASGLVCARCHNFIPAPGAVANAAAGPSVAPYWLWLGTMMRHSGVDPYWQAAVRREKASTPGVEKLTEETCVRCHQPAGRFDAALAEEGITCTVCHMMTPEKLGTRASYDAGFVLNGEAKMFGPHKDPFPMPMMMMAGYTPTYGPHVLDSAMCGSCHTVITPVLDGAGKAHGEFIEQAPYLEWKVSRFAREGRGCAECHMPVLRNAKGDAVEQYIAHRPNGSGWFPPTSPRAPFGQHTFLGGNTVIPALLAKQYPGRAEDLQRTVELNRAFLKTAVGLEARARRAGEDVELEVTLRNRTGHKLPTAYPSRRMWVHVKAEVGGRVVFESGKPGTVADGQPHREVIERGEQALVYEAEAVDLEGRTTVVLLRAARWGKDNRLLPEGFAGAGQDGAEVRAVGVGGDADFRAGEDTVRYRMAGVGGSARVTVRVMYQTIKPGHDLLGLGKGLGSEAEVMAEVVREVR